LPQSKKVAIFAEAVQGQNAGAGYRPGPTFEVRRQADESVAHVGKLRPWNGGKVSELCRDRGWHADFSDARAPGSCYLLDPAKGVRSYPFAIDEDVYGPVLRASLRTFYYQRSGTPIPLQYGGNWQHRGGHLGPDQDRAAKYTQGGKSLGRPRDLLGG